MYAAMDNRYNEAKVLVEAGADLDIQDKIRSFYYTFNVFYLFSFSHSVIIQVKGWSAICFAAEKTDVQIAKLLYKAGANIGFLDKVYYVMMMFGQCFLINVFSLWGVHGNRNGRELFWMLQRTLVQQCIRCCSVRRLRRRYA